MRAPARSTDIRTVRAYVCPKCEHPFGRYRTLADHLVDVHEIPADVALELARTAPIVAGTKTSVTSWHDHDVPRAKRAHQGAVGAANA